MLDRRAGIAAIACYLPETIVSNKSLEQENPDWDMSLLEPKTGVMQRHIATDNETALDLAAAASKALFAEQALSPDDIDYIIFCTQSNDYLMPSNSFLLHKAFDFPQSTGAIDLNIGCSGFVYALDVADALIKTGKADNVLLVTADTYSKMIDPKDRAVRSLFGDGAAATLVSCTQPPYGVIDIERGTSGKQYDRFIVETGGMRYPNADTAEPQKNYIKMDGMGVLSFFNSTIPKAVKALLDSNQLTTSDIEYFIFHQASKLALEGIKRSLGLSDQQMVMALEQTGNLVSSSVPFALHQLINQGKVKDGETLLCCGFGVGLSWASCLITYQHKQ